VKASASFGVSVSLLLVGLMAGVATVSPQRAAARDHASGLRLGPDWSAHAGFYNPQWSAGDAERESIESFSIPSFGLGRRPRVGYSIDPDLAGRHTKSPSVLRLNLKGFSLIEMKEGNADLRVRRIRQREMRRPIVSLQIKKRF
jgi:hypothetical protein